MHWDPPDLRPGTKTTLHPLQFRFVLICAAGVVDASSIEIVTLVLLLRPGKLRTGTTLRRERRIELSAPPSSTNMKAKPSRDTGRGHSCVAGEV